MMRLGNESYYTELPAVAYATASEVPRTDWFVDSGANCFVTDPHDTEIIVSGSVQERLVLLHTTLGPTKATRVQLRTPFGIQSGLLSAGSPRILPMDFISQRGYFHSEGGTARVCVDGVLIPLKTRDGIPVLPNDAVLLLQEVRTNGPAREPTHSLAAYHQSNIQGETADKSCQTISRDKENRGFSFQTGVCCGPVGSNGVRLANARNLRYNNLADCVSWPPPDTFALASVSSVEVQPSVACAGELDLSASDALDGADPMDVHALTHHPERDDCRVCKISKLKFAARRRTDRSGTKSEVTGERIIVDLATPWPKTPTGERTLLAGGDEASGALLAVPLRGKVPAGVVKQVTSFREQLSKVRAETGEEDPSSWFFKRDGGGEFEGNFVDEFLARTGGLDETTVPYRHGAQAERLVRTIAQGVRALILDASLPVSFWGFAATALQYNHNWGKVKGWKEALSREGRAFPPFRFGRLGYAKLRHDLVPQDKGHPAGRPVAALCYSSTARRGLVVAYRDMNDVLRTTTVDVGEVRLVEPEQMAFIQKVVDLRPLCVPGPAFQAGSRVKATEGYTLGGNLITLPTVGLVVPSVHSDDVVPVPVGGKETQRPPAFVNPSSSCPACRGRNRGHTYGPGCRHEGKSRQQVTRQRAEEARVAQVAKDARESSAHAAAAKSVTFTSSADVVKAVPAVNLAEQCMSTVSERHASSSGEVTAALATAVPAANSARSDADMSASRTIESEKLAAQVPRQQCESTSDTGLPVADGGARQGEFEDFVPRIIRELNAAHLEQRDSFGSLHLHENPRHAYMTRKMTKAEKLSPEGLAAYGSELHKLATTYSGFDKPDSLHGVAEYEPRATVSNFCMLGFVKHAEKDLLQQVLKGRGVILGDHIMTIKQALAYLLGQGRSGPTDSTTMAWDAMSSDLAALEEGRLIDLHAAINGFSVESADVESAYIQEPWPDDWPRHYVIIPAELWKFLPEDLRPAPGMRNPVWPMKKCIYGHPASGHVFVTSFLSFLEERGWKAIGKAGSRALMLKGRTLVCLYVDDIKASGPPDELAELWESFKGRYSLKETDGIAIQKTSEFLGVSQQIDVHNEVTTVRYSMADYCREIAKRFEELWERKPRPSSVPLSPTSSLRVRPDPVDGADSKRKPEHRVQQLIGMILWLARTTRPDLSLAASLLGSRVASWNEECERELERCVSYLRDTASAELQLVWRHGDTPRVVLYSDADWSAPRSQSGYMLCLESTQADENGVPSSFAPLLWGSKRQGIIADSAAASETVAAHTAVRACLGSSDSIFTVFHSAPNPLVLKIDNTQVLRLIKKGTSDKLWFACKSCNLRMGVLKECVTNGVVRAEHVGTLRQRGDLFTKIFAAGELSRVCRLVGLHFPDNGRISRGRVWAALARLGNDENHVLPDRVIESPVDEYSFECHFCVFDSDFDSDSVEAAFLAHEYRV